MRAFIAIEIPDAIKAGLAAVQAQLKCAGVDAGWSRSEGIHLTLKFLGEVSEERVPEIMQALALELGGTGRFRLSPEGVGTFPNPASARVVWLGIAGDVMSLVALQASVERVLAGLGMERDERPYTPHLTLGRIKRIRKREVWLKALEGIKNFRIPGFDVTAVSLIESELRPAGAVYRQLGRVVLQEGPG
jgi:2'-5' RNA ligase